MTTTPKDSINFISEDEPKDKESDASGNEKEWGENIVHTYEGEDIEEEETRQTFQKPPMHQFTVFVSCGLPDKFLKAHPELLEKSALNTIQKAIENKIHDPVLRRYLEFRLNMIKIFQVEQQKQEIKFTEIQ